MLQLVQQTCAGVFRRLVRIKAGEVGIPGQVEGLSQWISAGRIERRPTFLVINDHLAVREPIEDRGRQAARRLELADAAVEAAFEVRRVLKALEEYEARGGEGGSGQRGKPQTQQRKYSISARHASQLRLGACGTTAVGGPGRRPKLD